MIIFNLAFTRAIKLMKILALQKEESWASLSQMSNQSYFKSQKTRRKTKRTSDKQTVSEKRMSAKRGIMRKKFKSKSKESGKWERIGQTLMKTTTKITKQTL